MPNGGRFPNAGDVHLLLQTDSDWRLAQTWARGINARVEGVGWRQFRGTKRWKNDETARADRAAAARCDALIDEHRAAKPALERELSRKKVLWKKCGGIDKSADTLSKLSTSPHRWTGLACQMRASPDVEKAPDSDG